MKFSVLLPTRNRLELLKFAMESILQQKEEDLEIIISDNNSEQNIEEYIKELKDHRIKYYNTKKNLSVVENWNFALSKSSGDYIIMLGDDDCLLNNYFSTLRKLIEEFSSPEMIYSHALFYAYPKALPFSETGFLHAYEWEIFSTRKKPFFLNKNKALYFVKKSMNFRHRFGYNMQYITFSRGLIKKLEEKGSFFQSPYPDYYATNALLLTSKTTLIYPFPLTIIGISLKSFGYYYFNNRENEGLAFLNNLNENNISNKLEKILLPGPNMTNSWLLSMETIKQNYFEEFNLSVNYKNYRTLQILELFHKNYDFNEKNKKDLLKKLNFVEKLFVEILFLNLLIFRKKMFKLLVSLIRSFFYARFKRKDFSHDHKNILEAFYKFKPEDFNRS